MTLARPWIRTLAYTLLAMAAASMAMFAGLSADRIWGDEAVYASCVDTIHETGKWVSPAPYPGAHYFQKPPLQMWLTAATYRFFPDVMRYRVWPAAFGVMSVGITCLLAAGMFSPEVGLLAGLLLATNNRFLFEHGTRAGTFDSGLTFLILLATAIYWRGTRDATLTPPEGANERSDTMATVLPIATEPSPYPLPEYWERDGGERLTGWIFLGVAIGLAGLLKPLAGLPLLLLFAIHTLTLPRRCWTQRGKNLLLAFGVSILVALPWFVIESIRFGSEFWHEIFARNIVDRVTVGVDPRQLHELLYYIRVISRASTAFALGLPAMLFAVFACFAGSRRFAWRLIAIVAVGWVVLFSLSPSKATHYVYPAFPTISICIAGLLAWVIERGATFFKSAEFRDRTQLVGYGGLTTAMMLNAIWFGASRAAQPGKRYEPYELYRAFEPVIRTGEAKFVIAGYDGDSPLWYGRPGLEATDLFYLRRMPGMAPDAPALQAALEPHHPTLLMLPRTGPVDQRPAPERVDRRFIADGPGYTIYGVDLDSLTRLAAHDLPLPFNGSATTRLRTPVPGAALLSLRAKLAEPIRSQILCKVLIDGQVLNESSVAIDGLVMTVSAEIDRSWLPRREHVFELRWRALSGDAAVAGTLESLELNIDPTR